MMMELKTGIEMQSETAARTGLSASPDLFGELAHDQHQLRSVPEVGAPVQPVEAHTGKTPMLCSGKARLYHGDCFHWLEACPANSIHAVVTDPPYGLVEYTEAEQRKLHGGGKGGVWRVPPSYDGHKRSPLPRFTTLRQADLDHMTQYFAHLGATLARVLVPGAHVFVASNPLVCHLAASALASSGLENRGIITRLVMTMRGGDRPKNAHEEFPDVTVMPRSMAEPWLLFRKPLEGRVQDNLRKWGTGGLRRISQQRPFGDVIKSHPTRPSEKRLAPHPSLKPQAFLRQLVCAALPLGKGVILDPFAGSGATLAAANHLGHASIGIEISARYFELASVAIPRLEAFKCPDTPNSA